MRGPLIFRMFAFLVHILSEEGNATFFTKVCLYNLMEPTVKNFVQSLHQKSTYFTQKLSGRLHHNLVLHKKKTS